MQLAFTINGSPAPLPSVLVPIANSAEGFGFNYIGFIVNIVYVIAIVLALAYILFGGVKWILSEGDHKKMADARQTLVYAAVGLTVIFISILLVNLLGAFFGISFLGLPQK